MSISPTLTLTVDKTVAYPGETVTLLGSLDIPKENGDIYKDNKIAGEDLVLVARAFGSYPGHPRWNSDADVNKDGKVNAIDLVIIARLFGQYSGNKPVNLYVSSDGVNWTPLAQVTTSPSGTIGSFSYNYTIPSDTKVGTTLYFMAHFPGGIY
jgi:hypothetical protein